MRKVRVPRHRRERFSEEGGRLTRADIIEKLNRENLLPAITFIFHVLAAMQQSSNACKQDYD